jgi:4-diphosphocytidyl-2-C-methyl-D-erythritol kinase
MIVFPNAKINIGLNITEKRPDGFHNIESCFYPVGWSDALEILPSEKFSFKSSGLPIPGDNDQNLCAKAYQLIAADYSIEGVDMHLLKSVPIGAGLGGGSADAAFAIKALDQLFDLEIPIEKQMDYARKLGSDCAFFIPNEPAYCFHKGDEFEQVDLKLTGRWIVLVNPGIHISTAEAYAGIVPQRSEHILRMVLQQPLSTWRDLIKNDFEATLFPKYPLLPLIKAQLYEKGALYASMSGSGSTVYGIFDEEIDLSAEFSGYMLWQGLLR